jgi:pyridoxamine 5'-phosphate oxidase
MVIFINNSSKEPLKKFRKEYQRATNAEQLIVEAMCVSSFNASSQIVDSRFVNLKIVDSEKFIFFSNYDSPKSVQFESHEQVALNIFWNTTNVQIRMKGSIKRASKKYNEAYFKNRSPKKNALAISSHQSQKIDCYESVKKKYQAVFKNENLKKCPEYWGGFIFRPFYFEFWEGNSSRLNHRNAFELKGDNTWKEFCLEP